MSNPFDFSAIQLEHLTLAATGYGVVFFSLILLYFIFSIMPKVLDFRLKKQPDLEGHATHGAHHTPTQSGEVNAAIAMAISLYFSELHDQETAILTIKKAAKTYSPWNSKIYNVINFKGAQR